MPRIGKRMKSATSKVDADKKYDLATALGLAKETAAAKFDETVEMAVRLGVDPTKADQMVRGAVALPKGTGRTRTIIVFAKGEKAVEAEKAGANFVGADDLIAKITGGWLDFDVAVATPDMMGQVGKVARVLGPRGLMPNPKSGTVTFDLEKTIQEIQAGKVEFRVEKAGIVHVPIGKAGFSAENLFANATAVIDQLQKMKPASAKGTYLKSISVSSTMGPGIGVDTSQAGLSEPSAA